MKNHETKPQAHHRSVGQDSCQHVQGASISPEQHFAVWLMDCIYTDCFITYQSEMHFSSIQSHLSAKTRYVMSHDCVVV